MHNQSLGHDALGGIRVVDLTRGVAGPITGMTLADFGADVLKIESVEARDYGRIWDGFEIWNRGKRGVSLDLVSEAGQATLRELLDTADVVLDDSRPGSRVGATIARLVEESGVLHCRITAFGPAENGNERPGHEGAVSAEAGLYLGIDELAGLATSTPGDRPVFTVAPTNSFAAAHLAAQAILAALIARGRGRAVKQVETSLLQGALAMVMRRRFPRTDKVSARGPAPARPLTVQSGIALTFLTAECADGSWLQMCARQDAHFLAWLRAVGLDDAADDPRYAGGPLLIPTVDDISELRERLRSAMKQRSAAEWLNVFASAGVGADVFLTPEEFMKHPHVIENELVTTWSDTGEPTLGAIARMSETPARSPRPLETSEALWTDSGAAHSSAASGRITRTTPSAAGPLSGIVILEMAYYLAAPLATTLLAELGARVIKVEPTGGDPYRRTGAETVHLLHGKESIALDLKSSEGQQILRKLIARADALIQSFRPGVADRLGFGYEQCRLLNPKLVYLLSTGYGSHGPLSSQPAFHSTANAWSGGGFLQTAEGCPPVNSSYPDPAAAVVNATALMIGLTAHERLGIGQYIETSMLSSGAHVLSNWYSTEGQRKVEPQDSLQRGHGVMYRLYECRDGWIFLSAPSAGAWNAFAKRLSQHNWVLETVPRTWAELIAATAPRAGDLERYFGERSADDVVAQLNSPEFAVVRADEGTLEEFLERRDLVDAATHADFGDYWKLPSKYTVDGSRTPLGIPPLVGQNTCKILGELGFDAALVDDLVERGVVTQAD